MRKSDRQQGFTLLETIIALLILLIGLLAVAQLFIASTYSNVFAQNTTLAIKAAEDVLEQLNSISDWNPTTGDARIFVGGTVIMQNDVGGQAATSLPAQSPGNSDQKHVTGYYFEPVFDSGRLKSFDMRQTEVGDANWSKRRFEVRWQVIGYNAAGSVQPNVQLTDAYTCGTCVGNPTPNFANLLSAPTPPKPDINEQNSVFVIIRVAPVAQDNKTTKRVQLATVLTNPK